MNYKIFLILGVFIITLISCGSNDDFKQLSHQDFLKTHDFNIGQTTLNLKDNERKRPIKAEIWYPTKDTTKTNITIQYPFKLPPTSRDADLISEKFYFHTAQVVIG